MTARCDHRYCDARVRARGSNASVAIVVTLHVSLLSLNGARDRGKKYIRRPRNCLRRAELAEHHSISIPLLEDQSPMCCCLCAPAIWSVVPIIGAAIARADLSGVPKVPDETNATTPGGVVGGGRAADGTTGE